MEKKMRKEYCGLVSYRPHWLQRFATGFWFTSFSCLVILIQGIYFGYVIGMLTTIEKRFKITSFRSGALLSSYDMGHAISVLLIGHYGPWLHKPKWIGLGAMSNALACFGVAATHFLFKNYDDAQMLSFRHDDKVTVSNDYLKVELCNNITSNKVTTEDMMLERANNSASDWWAFFLLLAFQFQCGISSSPLTTLTYVYVDDNASPKKVSFYFGLLTAMWGYGPAFGFGLAVICTQIYVTLLEPPANITISSVHWIGAWWLGFLCLGITYAIAGLPFFFYPKNLHISQKTGSILTKFDKTDVESDETVDRLMLDALSTSHSSKYHSLQIYDDGNMSFRWFFVHLAKIPKQIWKMLQNKIFLCVTGTWIFSAYVIGGYTTFLPKYIEVHFHQSSHIASTYGGLLTALTAATSCAIGGKILSIFNPKPHKSNLILALCTLSAAFSFLILIFIDCPRPSIVGFDSKSDTFCDRNCHCSSNNYEPICSGEEVYFSPCLAGCLRVNGTNENVLYDSCQCAKVASAKPGLCIDQCQLKLITYLVGTILTGIVAHLFQVSQFTTLIRSVPPEDKSMSYALANFFCSIMGFLPSQILFGKVIDTTCIKWDNDRQVANRNLNCQIYDNNLLRIRYHLLTAAFAFCSFVTVAFCSYFSFKFSFFH